MIARKAIHHRLFLLALLALVGACNRSPDDSALRNADPVSSPPAVGYAARPENEVREPSVETPVKISGTVALPGLSAEDAAAIVHTPVVFMSEKHRATCVCGVGDAFPPMELTTIGGQATTLDPHRGTRLTVVVFWSLQYPASLEQISRIDDELVRRFGATGVRTVTVNVGDSSEDVQSYLDQIDVGDAAVLLDTHGDAFAMVASEMIPRTYLLDATGSIRWFDVEYSRSTRRELRNAIIYNLRIQAEDTSSDGDPLM